MCSPWRAPLPPTKRTHNNDPQGHRSRVGKRLAAHVRAKVVQRTSLQSKAALSAEAQRWIEEADVLPPGAGR